MNENTEFIYQRINEFDRQQKIIIAGQARCDEQNRQMREDNVEIKTALRRLISQSDQHKGSMMTWGIVIGGFSGMIGATSDWIVHHMGFFT